MLQDLPPGLRVHGWRPVRKDSATEALVFVPGFNASAEAALLALGQLLGSGDFPGRIKPFVFSWPTGGTFGYFQARVVLHLNSVSLDWR
jgi:esterase/lipase superfamily enzyme